jgi:hypothetical protein
LLAVIAYVDARLRLLGHDGANRIAASGCDFIRINDFAECAPNEQASQIFRSRETSGMCGQNSVDTATHRGSFS